jgi:hypothetical protein
MDLAQIGYRIVKVGDQSPLRVDDAYRRLPVAAQQRLLQPLTRRRESGDRADELGVRRAIRGGRSELGQGVPRLDESRDVGCEVGRLRNVFKLQKGFPNHRPIRVVGHAGLVLRDQLGRAGLERVDADGVQRHPRTRVDHAARFRGAEDERQRRVPRERPRFADRATVGEAILAVTDSSDFDE